MILVFQAIWLVRYLGVINNYPPKGRRIMVDIHRDAKRRGIYPPLFTDPEGDSCFSIYQIRWIKKRFFNFFFWNFRETTRHFSLRSQNSEYPRILQVTGANQNARKLLSTDLVSTNWALFTPFGVNNAWSKQNKMPSVNSRFATISEAQILKIQDAVPGNTKKATNRVVEITEWAKIIILFNLGD